MKLNVFILFIIFYQIDFAGYSQNDNITLDLKDVRIEEAIDAIESLTEYKFFFDINEVDIERKVSIYVDNAQIQLVLEIIFKDDQVFYEILGEQIILKKDNRAQYDISGIVTDQSGEPLSGVNIIIEGYSTGVITDFDGKYTIKVSLNSILIFSFIGMKTQKIVIENDNSIDTKLSKFQNELDEVIISVGYGFKRKINLSGAVATVGEEVFQDRGVTTVGQALQGTIANLNITSTSSPNTVPEYNIRGVTSIQPDGSIITASPLIIIDGNTATENDLGRMNPNDIASVTVLKDAAASSIYGSRAAFGVIIINTKRGKSDKMTIHVGFNFRIHTLGRTPEIEYDPYKVSSFLNDMAKPWYSLYNLEELEYAQQVSHGNAEPTRINPNDPNEYQYFHSTNWRKELLNDVSYSHTANMNISQKLERGRYYLSLEGVKNTGIYKHNNDIQKRYNLRLVSDYDITKWLNFSNNTWIYNNEYDESNAAGSSFFRKVIGAWTTQPIYNEDGSYTDYGAWSKGSLLGGNYNTNENGVQTSFALKTNFFDGKLTANGNASFKRVLTERATYDTPVEYSNGPGHKAVQGPSESWASFNNWREEWDNYNLYATYKDTYNKKHTLTVLAGYNQEDYLYNRTDGLRSGLISQNLPTVALATGNQEVDHAYESWADQGFFGRINYILAHKYIIELNGRYDGSSRYYKDDRWVFNPSVSASWVASKEGFLENSFFDLLKFRISYGSLGNQNAGTYATYPFLGTGNASSLINGANIVNATSPGIIAPTFTWETIQTKNIGIDVAFLNNKLSSSFDYFHRLTLDMFAPGLELPAVLGTNEPDENATDLKTEGWEFHLSWRDDFNLASKAFHYNINFNLGNSQAYITKYPNPTNSLDNWRVGQEIGEIWGFVSDGYFESQEDIDFSADQTDVSSYPSTRPVEPGDIKFKDLDGNGFIDFGDNTLENPGDRMIIGNSRAGYNFGLDIKSEWNGFDLRIFIQGVRKKNYYPEGWQARSYFWSAYAFPWSAVTKENYYNHWTPTNRDAFYPRPKSYVAEGAGSPGNGPAEVSLPQTRWLQDASYVRLKNITLAYTLPKTLPKTLTNNIGSIRFFAIGENLFEVTKLFKYLDPENLTGDGYPFRRTYSLGLSLTF